MQNTTEGREVSDTVEELIDEYYEVEAITATIKRKIDNESYSLNATIEGELGDKPRGIVHQTDDGIAGVWIPHKPEDGKMLVLFVAKDAARYFDQNGFHYCKI